MIRPSSSLFQSAQEYIKGLGPVDLQMKLVDDIVSLVDGHGSEIFIDFDENNKDYGRKSRLGGKEIIVKALAGDRKLKRVLDLSAGLGIDAVFLAMNGFQVTSIERNPILYLLLAQAKERSRRQDILGLNFVYADSKKFLNDLALEHSFDCAYFDPMYPEKRKSALPRKEMQIFRKLVGDDSDAAEILQLILRKKFLRTVVKRPLKAPELGPGVKHSFKGKTVRYDLYVME